MLEFLCIGKPSSSVDFVVTNYDVGYSDFAIVTSTGDLYFYGSNAYGQMGTGDTTTPGGWLKSSITNVDKVWKNGSTLTIVRKKDNTLWFAGTTYAANVIPGQASGAHYTWTEFTSTVSVTISTIKKMLPSYSCSGFITTDNKIFWTGTNSNGRFGNGTTTALTVYTQVTTASLTPTDLFINGYNGTRAYSLVIDSSGYVWGAGTNGDGVLSAASSTYFKLSTTLGTWSQISCGSNFWVGISAGRLYFSGISTSYGSDSTTRTLSSLTGSATSPVKTTAASATGLWLSSQSTQTNNVGLQAGSAASNLPIVNTSSATDGLSSSVLALPSNESATNSSFYLLMSTNRNGWLVYDDTSGVRLYARSFYIQGAVANAVFQSIPLPSA